MATAPFIATAAATIRERAFQDNMVIEMCVFDEGGGDAEAI